MSGTSGEVSTALARINDMSQVRLLPIMRTQSDSLCSTLLLQTSLTLFETEMLWLAATVRNGNGAQLAALKQRMSLDSVPTKRPRSNVTATLPPRTAMTGSDTEHIVIGLAVTLGVLTLCMLCMCVLAIVRIFGPPEDDSLSGRSSFSRTRSSTRHSYTRVSTESSDSLV
ncbi:MAG: hypothetical protein MHM6MM_004687 [Cercozoa sp. M6MM]